MQNNLNWDAWQKYSTVHKCISKAVHLFFLTINDVFNCAANVISYLVVQLLSCFCCQEYGANADEWSSVICSKLEAASHCAPRGKHARHANIMRLVRISAPSLNAVIDSLKQLAVAGQLSCMRRQNDSDSSFIKNSQSTVLWYALLMAWAVDAMGIVTTSGTCWGQEAQSVNNTSGTRSCWWMVDQIYADPV